MTNDRLIYWAFNILSSQRWIIKSGSTVVRSLDDIYLIDKIDEITKFDIYEEVESPWYYLWFQKHVTFKEVGSVSYIPNTDYTFGLPDILVVLIGKHEPLELVQRIRGLEREAGKRDIQLLIDKWATTVTQVAPQPNMLSTAHSQG